MPRIRSVHPGLFTDEAFMSASVYARLLIIGLWTEAWDDGVFEWKPIVIKARLFPADTCDVASLLSEIEALGVIKCVERQGKPYGLIRNFRRFQRPKKPNSSGVILPSDADFLGPEHISSEPVPNRFRTSSEISPQMEDGGGRRERKKETSSLRSDVAPEPVLPKKEKVKRPNEREAARQALALFVSDENAEALVRHREAIGHPLTGHAATLLGRQLLKIPDPDEGAEMILLHGWRGFKAEWYENAKRQSQIPLTNGVRKNGH